MGKDMKYSEVRQIVYNRYRGKCAICGQKLTFEDMCISLIVPKSKGGGKDFANMKAACETCAGMKHDMTQDEFLKKVFSLSVHNIRDILKTYRKGENHVRY